MQLPAQFTSNRKPRHWPQARGQGLARMSNADEIVAQEWKIAMGHAILEARINVHHIPEGPVVQTSKNGLHSIACSSEYS